MNEILRIIDRLLKKQGYSIKRHPEYNLIPLMDFNIHPDQRINYEYFNSNNKPEQDNIDKLEICLRTCINNKRAQSKRSELTNVSLEEHLLTCITSLLVSVNEALLHDIDINFTIFDDRSNTDVLDRIKNLCGNLNCEWKVITTDNPGQGESLHQHYSYARNKNALFYFCEDDYLHDPSAISEMVNFYKKVYAQTSSHLLIHPQEHEFIYSRYNYPSYILLGENRRWRTMSDATHTFFTHSSIVKCYWNYFENTKFVGIKQKRYLGSEKNTTNQLFNHIPGFSPIPAVAIHFQSDDCLPPFFDWKSLWGKAHNLFETWTTVR